ncbi:hypothetical protein [Novosphingobium sp.]|uniref:hypothetical protein n=1 Tax=Novosphingobium sp. TaxID=1874826 RepID=UPI002FDF5E9B
MSDAEFQAWQVDISGVTQDGERYRCRYIFTPRQTRFHLLGPGADAPIEADDELLDLIDSYLKSGILVNLDGWSRDQVVALLFGEQ